MHTTGAVARHFVSVRPILAWTHCSEQKFVSFGRKFASMEQKLMSRGAKVCVAGAKVEVAGARL